MSSLGGSTVSSSYNRLLVLPAGGGDANNLVTLSDGDNATTFALKISTGGIAVDTNDKIYLDNGGDTYISETTDDRIDFYTGGNRMLRLDHSSSNNSVFVTADYLQIFDKDASSPKINIGSNTNTETIDGTSRTIHEISLGGSNYGTALLQLGRDDGGHPVSIMGSVYITSANGTGGDAMIRFRGHKDNVKTPLWRIAVDESQSDKLKFFDEVNGIYRMALTQDGYLGVGTDSPITTLDVRGNRRFQGIGRLAAVSKTVDSNGAIDVLSSEGPIISLVGNGGDDNLDMITVDGGTPTAGMFLYLVKGTSVCTIRCYDHSGLTDGAAGYVGTRGFRCVSNIGDSDNFGADLDVSYVHSMAIGNAYRTIKIVYQNNMWTVHDVDGVSNVMTTS